MSNSPKGFTFITPVWGESHIGTFLEIGLRSLLSNNNLPALKNLSNSSYMIFTSKNEIKRLKSHFLFKRLQTLMKVEVEVINPAVSNPHDIMSRCHRVGLKRAYQQDLGAVLVPPDCVWSDGSMKNMEQIVSSRQVSVIHMSGLRLIKETVVPVLKTYINADDLLSLSSRFLAKTALSHLHPITESHFFEGEGYLMPANLLWNVGDEGILAHCFHLHPLYISPSDKNHRFKVTVDDDLTLYREDQMNYIVSDSDEILAFEVSSLTHNVLATYQKGSIDDIVLWAQIGTNSTHRQLIKTPIRIHTNETSKKGWKRTEKSAQKVVETILTGIENPSSTHLKNNNLIFQYIRTRPFVKFIHRHIVKILFILDTLIEKRSLQARLKGKFYRLLEKENVNSPGKKILYIDGEMKGVYKNIQPSKDEDLEITHIRKEHLLELCKNFGSEKKILNLEEVYDYVVLRLAEISTLEPSEVLLIDKLLKKDGIFLITFRTPNLKENLTKKLPSRYKIIKEFRYGTFGYVLAINIIRTLNRIRNKMFPRTQNQGNNFYKRKYRLNILYKNPFFKILIKLYFAFICITIYPILCPLLNIIGHRKVDKELDVAIWFQK